MDNPIATYGTIPVDKDGRVRVDLPCPECGYNLRGIHRDHTCPECGAVVRLAESHYLEKGRRPDREESVIVGLLLILGAMTFVTNLTSAQWLAWILLGTTFVASILALVRGLVLGPRTAPSVVVAGIYVFILPPAVCGLATMLGH